jgi:hypothetical protein
MEKKLQEALATYLDADRVAKQRGDRDSSQGADRGRKITRGSVCLRNPRLVRIGFLTRCCTIVRDYVVAADSMDFCGPKIAIFLEDFSSVFRHSPVFRQLLGRQIGCGGMAVSGPLRREIPSPRSRSKRISQKLSGAFSRMR